MQNSNAKVARRYEYDVTRELIVLGVNFFHTARIFDDLGNFYVKNDTVSPVASLFNMLAVQIGMPTLFVIAGFSIWSSLQKRSPGKFISERLRRLIVPFIVAVFVTVPPQKYFQLLRNPAYDEAYRHFYLRFFDISFALDFPWFLTGAPGTRLFDRANAWFLYDLFAFTMILLPIFLYLQTKSGKGLVGSIAEFFLKPYAIFLFAIPIALIEAAFKTDFAGGWGKSTYIPFIICGYLIGSDGRFAKALCKHKKIALAFSAVTFAVGITFYSMLSKELNIDPLTSYDWMSLLFRAVKGINGWCISVAILGFLETIRRSRQDDQKKRFGTIIEQYANKAILPFYLLHETALIMIGFHVVQWQIGIALKFLIISFSSFAVTLLIYDVVVKRFKLTRLLFGMKPDVG